MKLPLLIVVIVKKSTVRTDIGRGGKLDPELQPGGSITREFLRRLLTLPCREMGVGIQLELHGGRERHEERIRVTEQLRRCIGVEQRVGCERSGYANHRQHRIAEANLLADGTRFTKETVSKVLRQHDHSGAGVVIILRPAMTVGERY